RPFPELKGPVALGGGRDGRPPALSEYLGDPGAAPDERTGLAALSGEDEISLVTSPDMHRVPGLSEALARSCGERGDRFAILHTGPGLLPWKQYHPPFTSGYAALYYPWIIVKKERGRAGVPIPPCGHIAGAFARVDRTLGVHHSPSGESLAGVLGLASPLAREEEDVLDRIGVNTIRAFPGGRFTVLGSGTLDPGGIRSIATRRLLICLEQSICRGIGWAVHEPDTRAVEGLRASIREFLQRAWAGGKLAGKVEREAFFVRDGRDKDGAGRKTGPPVFEIGVAPEKRGEFVVFTITRESSRFTVQEV
ncbi:MAG TPA: phage tail sheath subtilisin-like domain-containing protein, partial [Methanomicrobiales archaeon]|nr:phage tail sheath subtilisin-like domain-containing protein [Methanomicrobiales archaeon]